MLKRILSSNHFVMVTCLLITGLGIGWLVGLSVSPVVSIVITSVTGSAAAIVAALSGLEEKPDVQVARLSTANKFVDLLIPYDRSFSLHNGYECFYAENTKLVI